jgi:hypothetical protein
MGISAARRKGKVSSLQSNQGANHELDFFVVGEKALGPAL